MSRAEPFSGYLKIPPLFQIIKGNYKYSAYLQSKKKGKMAHVLQRQPLKN